MKKTTIVLAALALTAGGCGGNESSVGEEDPPLTGEETRGELPEKEPVRQNDGTTAR